MIVLACIALGIAAMAVPGAFAFAWQANKRASDLIAARDLLDSEREHLSKARGDLDVEAAAHAVTAKQLEQERQLRAATEAQRNAAYRRAREFYADKLKASNVADAVRLVDELLAMPVVPEDHDVPAGDPARTDDDLQRP